jgi:hypothetical protein
MQALPWARAPYHLQGIRRGAASAPMAEVIREVGRAVAALAAVLAWGTLLLLLAA